MFYNPKTISVTIFTLIYFLSCSSTIILATSVFSPCSGDCHGLLPKTSWQIHSGTVWYKIPATIYKYLAREQYWPIYYQVYRYGQFPTVWSNVPPCSEVGLSNHPCIPSDLQICRKCNSVYQLRLGLDYSVQTPFKYPGQRPNVYIHFHVSWKNQKQPANNLHSYHHVCIPEDPNFSFWLKTRWPYYKSRRQSVCYCDPVECKMCYKEARIQWYLGYHFRIGTYTWTRYFLPLVEGTIDTTENYGLSELQLKPSTSNTQSIANAYSLMSDGSMINNENDVWDTLGNLNPNFALSEMNLASPTASQYKAFPPYLHYHPSQQMAAITSRQNNCPDYQTTKSRLCENLQCMANKFRIPCRIPYKEIAKKLRPSTFGKWPMFDPDTDSRVLYNPSYLRPFAPFDRTHLKRFSDLFPKILNPRTRQFEVAPTVATALNLTSSLKKLALLISDKIPHTVTPEGDKVYPITPEALSRMAQEFPWLNSSLLKDLLKKIFQTSDQNTSLPLRNTNPWYWRSRPNTNSRFGTRRTHIQLPWDHDHLHEITWGGIQDKWSTNNVQVNPWDPHYHKFPWGTNVMSTISEKSSFLRNWLSKITSIYGRTGPTHIQLPLEYDHHMDESTGELLPSGLGTGTILPWNAISGKATGSVSPWIPNTRKNPLRYLQAGKSLPWYPMTGKVLPCDPNSGTVLPWNRSIGKVLPWNPHSHLYTGTDIPMDPSIIKVLPWNPSTGNNHPWNPKTKTDNGLPWEISSENNSPWDPSTGKVLPSDQIYGKFRPWDQSFGKVLPWDPSTGKVLPWNAYRHQHTGTGNINKLPWDISTGQEHDHNMDDNIEGTGTIQPWDTTTGKILPQQLLADGILPWDVSSGKVLPCHLHTVRPTGSVSPWSPNTGKNLLRNVQTGTILPWDSSGKFFPYSPSIGKVLPLDLNREIMLPWSSRTGNVLPWDTETVNVLPWGSNTGQVFPDGPSNVKVPPWDPITSRDLSWDASSGRVLPTSSSSSNVLPLDPSTGRVLSWDPSTDKVLPWDTSTDKVFPRASGTGKVLLWNPSTGKVLPWNQSTRNVLPSTGRVFSSTPSTRNDRVLPWNAITDKAFPRDPGSGKVLPWDPITSSDLSWDARTGRVLPTSSSSSNVLPLDTSTGRVLPWDPSTGRVLPWDPSTVKVLPWDPSTDKVFPRASGAGQVLAWNPSTGNVLPWNPSTDKVLPWDLSTDKVFPRASGTGKVLPWNPSTRNVLPSTGRAFSSAPSTQHMLFRDPSPDRVLPWNAITDKSFPRDPGSGEVLPWDPITSSDLYWDASSRRVLPTSSSTSNVLPLDSSTGRVFPWDPSTGRVLPWDPGTVKVLPWDPSTDKVFPRASGAVKVLPWNPSTGKVLPWNMSTDKVLPWDPSTDKVFPRASGTGKVLTWSPSARNVLPSTGRVFSSAPSTRNMPFRDPSPNRVLSWNAISDKAFPRDPGSGKVLPWDPITNSDLYWDASSGRVLPTSSSSSNVLPLDPSTGRVLPWDSSTDKVFPRASGAEKVLPWNPSTGKVLPWDPSSDRVLPWNAITNKAFPRDPGSGKVLPWSPVTGNVPPWDSSTGKVLFQDPCTGRVLPWDLSTGKVLPRGPNTDRGFHWAPSNRNTLLGNTGTGRVLTWVPRTERVLPRDPSTGRVLPWDLSTGKVLSSGPNAGRVFPRASSNRNVLPGDTGTGRVLPWVPNSSRVLPDSVPSNGKPWDYRYLPNVSRSSDSGKVWPWHPCTGRVPWHPKRCENTGTVSPLNPNTGKIPFWNPSYRVLPRDLQTGEIRPWDPNSGKMQNLNRSTGKILPWNEMTGRVRPSDFTSPLSPKMPKQIYEPYDLLSYNNMRQNDPYPRLTRHLPFGTSFGPNILSPEYRNKPTNFVSPKTCFPKTPFGQAWPNAHQKYPCFGSHPKMTPPISTLYSEPEYRDENNKIPISGSYDTANIIPWDITHGVPLHPTRVKPYDSTQNRPFDATSGIPWSPTHGATLYPTNNKHDIWHSMPFAPKYGIPFDISHGVPLHPTRGKPYDVSHGYNGPWDPNNTKHANLVPFSPNYINSYPVTPNLHTPFDKLTPFDATGQLMTLPLQGPFGLKPTRNVLPNSNTDGQALTPYYRHTPLDRSSPYDKNHVPWSVSSPFEFKSQETPHRHIPYELQTPLDSSRRSSLNTVPPYDARIPMNTHVHWGSPCDDTGRLTPHINIPFVPNYDTYGHPLTPQRHSSHKFTPCDIRKPMSPHLNGQWGLKPLYDVTGNVKPHQHKQYEPLPSYDNYGHPMTTHKHEPISTNAFGHIMTPDTHTLPYNIPQGFPLNSNFRRVLPWDINSGNDLPNYPNIGRGTSWDQSKGRILPWNPITNELLNWAKNSGTALHFGPRTDNFSPMDTHKSRVLLRDPSTAQSSPWNLSNSKVFPTYLPSGPILPYDTTNHPTTPHFQNPWGLETPYDLNGPMSQNKHIPYEPVNPCNLSDYLWTPHKVPCSLKSPYDKYTISRSKSPFDSSHPIPSSQHIPRGPSATRQRMVPFATYESDNIASPHKTYDAFSPLLTPQSHLHICPRGYPITPYQPDYWGPGDSKIIRQSPWSPLSPYNKSGDPMVPHIHLPYGPNYPFETLGHPLTPHKHIPREPLSSFDITGYPETPKISFQWGPISSSHDSFGQPISPHRHIPTGPTPSFVSIRHPSYDRNGHPVPLGPTSPYDSFSHPVSFRPTLYDRFGHPISPHRHIPVEPSPPYGSLGNLVPFRSTSLYDRLGHLVSPHKHTPIRPIPLYDSLGHPVSPHRHIPVEPITPYDSLGNTVPFIPTSTYDSFGQPISPHRHIQTGPTPSFDSIGHPGSSEPTSYDRNGHPVPLGLTSPYDSFSHPVSFGPTLYDSFGHPISPHRHIPVEPSPLYDSLGHTVPFRPTSLYDKLGHLVYPHKHTPLRPIPLYDSLGHPVPFIPISTYDRFGHPVSLGPTSYDGLGHPELLEPRLYDSSGLPVTPHRHIPVKPTLPYDSLDHPVIFRPTSLYDRLGHSVTPHRNFIPIGPITPCDSFGHPVSPCRQIPTGPTFDSFGHAGSPGQTSYDSNGHPVPLGPTPPYDVSGHIDRPMPLRPTAPYDNIRHLMPLRPSSPYDSFGHLLSFEPTLYDSFGHPITPHRHVPEGPSPFYDSLGHPVSFRPTSLYDRLGQPKTPLRHTPVESTPSYDNLGNSMPLGPTPPCDVLGHLGHSVPFRPTFAYDRLGHPVSLGPTSYDSFGHPVSPHRHLPIPMGQISSFDSIGNPVPSGPTIHDSNGHPVPLGPTSLNDNLGHLGPLGLTSPHDRFGHIVSLGPTLYDSFGHPVTPHRHIPMGPTPSYVNLGHQVPLRPIFPYDRFGHLVNDAPKPSFDSFGHPITDRPTSDDKFGRQINAKPTPYDNFGHPMTMEPKSPYDSFVLPISPHRHSLVRHMSPYDRLGHRITPSRLTRWEPLYPSDALGPCRHLPMGLASPHGGVSTSPEIFGPTSPYETYNQQKTPHIYLPLSQVSPYDGEYPARTNKINSLVPFAPWMRDRMPSQEYPSSASQRPLDLPSSSPCERIKAFLKCGITEPYHPNYFHTHKQERIPLFVSSKFEPKRPLDQNVNVVYPLTPSQPIMTPMSEIISSQERPWSAMQPTTPRVINPNKYTTTPWDPSVLTPRLVSDNTPVSKWPGPEQPSMEPWSGIVLNPQWDPNNLRMTAWSQIPGITSGFNRPNIGALPETMPVFQRPWYLMRTSQESPSRMSPSLDRPLDLNRAGQRQVPTFWDPNKHRMMPWIPHQPEITQYLTSPDKYPDLLQGLKTPTISYNSKFDESLSKKHVLPCESITSNLRIPNFGTFLPLPFSFAGKSFFKYPKTYLPQNRLSYPSHDLRENMYIPEAKSDHLQPYMGNPYAYQIGSPKYRILPYSAYELENLDNGPIIADGKPNYNNWFMNKLYQPSVSPKGTKPIEYFGSYSTDKYRAKHYNYWPTGYLSVQERKLRAPLKGMPRSHMNTYELQSPYHMQDKKPQEPIYIYLKTLDKLQDYLGQYIRGTNLKDRLYNYAYKAEIPLKNINIFKYAPQSVQILKTDTPELHYLTWEQKVIEVQPVVVLRPKEYNIKHYMLILNDKITKYFSPEQLNRYAYDYIKSNYGDPIVLKGVFGSENPYAVVNPQTFSGGKYHVLWPPVCPCSHQSGCECLWSKQ